MKVNKLKLKDFRNYEDGIITFSDGVNVIHGDNAQGKTNILESVHMFSMGKSNRTSRDAELIRHGCSSSEIFMDYTAYGRECTLKIELSKLKRKSIFYNDIPMKKVSELLGKFNVVYFGPELLDLVKSGPSGRRKNFDMLISQLRPNYFSALSQLKRIIESKNALLKMQNPNIAMIDILDEKLTSVSTEIITYRCEFINRIQEIATDIQLKISGGTENLSYRYMSSIGKIDLNEIPNKESIASSFRDKLIASKARELYNREVAIGPHREDICFDINQKDARAFASQGQQKTIVLVQKLAEVEVIKSEINETPILLLDDIMSEFDRKRQAFVMANIKDMQIIITCTDADELTQNLDHDSHKIRIENGNVMD